MTDDYARIALTVHVMAAQEISTTAALLALCRAARLVAPMEVESRPDPSLIRTTRPLG